MCGNVNQRTFKHDERLHRICFVRDNFKVTFLVSSTVQLVGKSTFLRSSCSEQSVVSVFCMLLVLLFATGRILAEDVRPTSDRAVIQPIFLFYAYNSG